VALADQELGRDPSRVQLEARSTGRNGATSRPTSPGSPVLIFEVDAAGVAEQSAPARRCDVRLVGCVRDRSSENGQQRLNGELSAVVVLRALTPSRLLSCVRAVTRGGASMSPEVLCQLLPAQRAEHMTAEAHQLTARELTVLRMLADGEVTRGIAEQLNYSERTVKNIVRDVLLKLGCRTRAHAVALATRQGVI
jgi:DNA-binding NarL/FixJ family response regulator